MGAVNAEGVGEGNPDYTRAVPLVVLVKMASEHVNFRVNSRSFPGTEGYHNHIGRTLIRYRLSAY